MNQCNEQNLVYPTFYKSHKINININDGIILLPGSFAWCASFCRAAAKLDVRVALRAALAPMELTPLLGETWLRGGTVAVFRGSFAVAGLIMFRGGGLDPGGNPAIQTEYVVICAKGQGTPFSRTLP